MGKTTTSLKLASRLNARYVSITDLVKTKKFFSTIDKKRKTLIADIEKISDYLQNILVDFRGTIILEGHYVVDVVSKQDVTIVFVLRRDPRVLKTVLDNRGFSGKKVWENVAAEILDVCLWDAVSVCGTEKVCEIDSTEKTVDELVDNMIMILEKKLVSNIGVVDWLGRLESMEQLDEFLKKI